MEKKLQKLAKMMDYLERAKREEAAPLIRAAFQQRLVEEQLLHEHEAQQEIELSRQRHDGDVAEKHRLSRMLEHKVQFQEIVINRRQLEYNRLRAQKEEEMNQILQQRRQEREYKRKMMHFLRTEEERLKKLREEEEARKREEAERKKKEEAERLAKLNEIAEKQKQRERELEEKERLRKESLRRPTDGPTRSFDSPGGARPLEPVSAAPAAAAATAAAATPAGPTTGKYVPRFLRGGINPPPAQAPSPAEQSETDRWDRVKGGSDGRRSDDRWGGSDGRRPEDRWGGSDGRRPLFGGAGGSSGSGSRSTWSSARAPPPRG